jgi:hypothetical protein
MRSSSFFKTAPRSLVAPPDSRISSAKSPLRDSFCVGLSGVFPIALTLQLKDGSRLRTTERRSSFSSELRLTSSDMAGKDYHAANFTACPM